MVGSSALFTEGVESRETMDRCRNCSRWLPYRASSWMGAQCEDPMYFVQAEASDRGFLVDGAEGGEDTRRNEILDVWLAIARTR